MDPHERIAQLSRDIGIFHVACRRLDAEGGFALRELDTVPIASMYKVLLALEVADAFESGSLAPDTPVRIPPSMHTPEGAGLTEFAYPVTVSLRDLIYMSLAWSDNTASDVLLDRVGVDAVVARAHRLGLGSVGIVGDCRTLLSNAARDFGYANDADAARADWEPMTDESDLALGRTTRASVADLARLAEFIELETAAAPAACRLVRQLMGTQVWTARFATAFPEPDWNRASKTGTLNPWRGEFGIVSRADGATFALAVAVRRHHRRTPGVSIDSAVSAVASSAVALSEVDDNPACTSRQ